MSQPGGFDAEALLLGYSAGELTAEEERALFEAAADDQGLFDQLMEAEAVRHALSFPEQRQRAADVLRAWESQSPRAADPEPSLVLPPPIRIPTPSQSAYLGGGSPHHARGLSMDVLRSVVSTVATTVSLRLCYSLLTAVGSSFVMPQPQPGEAPGPVVPPVPAILHLAHAAIAALLLAIQFTPFLRPQPIGQQDHPIARKCLAQFIAGWRWAWVTWLMLYGWLWINAGSVGRPDVVADILNCLTSFPLFWCFFVLDKPSVPVPGDPERNASFRKAIGTVWGIGAGVTVLAVAGRLHLWGLNEFGLVFMGIYDGLAIAFLVGRFDSHWMKVPRWMLAPLYGYALIQMIYVSSSSSRPRGRFTPTWSLFCSRYASSWWSPTCYTRGICAGIWKLRKMASWDHKAKVSPRRASPSYLIPANHLCFPSPHDSELRDQKRKEEKLVGASPLLGSHVMQRPGWSDYWGGRHFPLQLAWKIVCHSAYVTARRKNSTSSIAPLKTLPVPIVSIPIRSGLEFSRPPVRAGEFTMTAGWLSSVN
jgi:hypothetical protein